MQFPPDGAAWSGSLVELLLSLFSLGGVTAFPCTQLPWKGSLSLPCWCAARGSKWQRCQHPGTGRPTPAGLARSSSSAVSWHSPNGPDPQDLEPVRVIRDDALLRSRLSTRAAEMELSTTSGNWVERLHEAVGISTILFFVKENVMSNHGT